MPALYVHGQPLGGCAGSPRQPVEPHNERVTTLVAGVVAGVVGTLAMDLVWFVRYKRSGGESGVVAWETAEGLTSWDEASAPGKVGKLLFETITHQDLSASSARLTTNVMHWAYGVPWGVLFALAIGSPARLRLWHPPLFGALVWLASYVELPVAGFYKPLWEYDLRTLWDDFSAHLAYGTGVAASYWVSTVFRPG
jgi:uncharacterized membrane protein YagU involved in acid resistance